MATTEEQQFTNQTAGQADWDGGLNSNFTTAERGYHTAGRAGSALNTLDVLMLSSGGFFMRFDPNSTDAYPHAMTYTAAASGDSIQALRFGSVRTVTIVNSTSQFFVPGREYYVSAQSPGWIVDSYANALWKAGWGLPNGGFQYYAAYNAGPRPIARNLFQPPAVASFSVISGSHGIQPTLTAVTSSGLIFDWGAINSAMVTDIRFAARPFSSESYSVTARLRSLSGAGTQTAGICLVYSGGNITTFGAQTGVGINDVRIGQYTHQRSFSAWARSLSPQAGMEWLRIDVNTTNLNFYYGFDPLTWLHVASIGRSTHQTSISWVGAFLNCTSDGQAPSANSSQGKMNIMVFSGPP